jgi:hypothetical protein
MGGTALEAAKVQETAEETLDRHVREYQNELNILYAELRKIPDQGSYDALGLIGQIEQAKKDLGEADRKRRVFKATN